MSFFLHIQSVINGTAFRISVRKTNQKRKEPENSGEGTEENKAKPKPKEPKIARFPKESFVNKYYFLRVGPDVLKALGWEIPGKRLAVELDLKDGALIVRKPS